MQELAKEAVRGQEENVHNFKKNCRQFLVVLCNGIKKRFAFDDPLLRGMSIFEPSLACCSKRSYNSSLYPFIELVARAKPTDLQRVDDEWRQLPFEELPDEIRSEKEVDVFWHKLSQLNNNEGDRKFTVLPAFVLTVLSLPHSNADVERVFSKVTNTRSKLRNRLKTKNVEGCCLASECVKKNGNCCAGFQPSTEMVQRMAVKYYDDQEDDEESN